MLLELFLNFSYFGQDKAKCYSGMQLSYSSKFRVAVSVPVTWQIRKIRQIPSFSDEYFHAGFSSRKRNSLGPV